MSERPVQPRPRRLSDWINPADERKEHSLIDKIYKQKNLQIAWERVKANQGAGGIDGVRACPNTPCLTKFADRRFPYKFTNTMRHNTLAWCIMVYEHISSMELRF